MDAYIDQTETRGHLVAASYYNTMINTEKSILASLESERAALQKSLDDGVNSGQFAVGSEEFMDMKSAIDEVTKSIVESQTNIIDYGNSIRQLQWDVFDMIQDKISDINEEAEFLMDLLDANDLFDENGKTTEQGAATFGLLGVKYNTNMSLADQYAEEVKKLDAELAKDPYNQDLIERRQELLELQRDAISAAEDEKDAIKDLVSEGIQAQLDALQDLIDKYNDMIDREQEAYEYQKKVSEQQEEIAALEKQLSAYSGDDSEEGRLKRQETENQLKEARTNLEESQRDQQISETKKLLDDLYTNYEEILNMRLDNIDQLISDVIANVNSEASSIRDTISSEAASVGYSITESMNTIWSDSGAIGTILSNYNGNFTTTMTTLQNAVDQIKVYIAGMVEDAKKESETTNGGGSNGDSTPAPSPAPTPTPTPTPNNNNSGTDFFIYKYDSYWKDRLQPDISIVDRLKLHNYDSSFEARAGYFEKMGLGSAGSYIGSASQNLSMIRWMRDHGYAKGTKRVPKTGLYVTNEGAPETVFTRDGSILTPLNAGDMVLNNKAHKVIWDFANNPTGFLQQASSLPSLNLSASGANQNVNADIKLEFNLPNVKNYEDFITAMQKDPKFEQWIQEATIGQALGHGTMRKTHIKL